MIRPDRSPVDHYGNVVIKLAILVVLGLAMLIGAGLCWDWYRAKEQRAVWESQGISMTTWQVFFGAEPAPVIEKRR